MTTSPETAPVGTTRSGRPRVVVIGSGFGGLFAAQALEKAPVDITLIDLAARTVTSTILGRTTVHPYDELVVAAGAGHSYFGNDRFAECAPGMKSIDDALELR